MLSSSSKVCGLMNGHWISFYSGRIYHDNFWGEKKKPFLTDMTLHFEAGTMLKFVCQMIKISEIVVKGI